MSQKLQTPPRWSPSSFSPPSFSTLPFNSGNQVGAGFGTGYCDAQCPHDVKYINGEPNSQVEMAMVMVYFLVMVLMMMMVTMTSKHLQKDDFLKGLDPKRDGRQCGFRAFWLMLLRTRYLGSQWDLNGDHCHYFVCLMMMMILMIKIIIIIDHDQRFSLPTRAIQLGSSVAKEHLVGTTSLVKGDSWWWPLLW